jgi:hypothetical protein
VTGYDPVADGFTREQIEQWGCRGIYPPPYAGDQENPESLLVMLVNQDRWQDPPSLSGSDDEGVIRQMAEFQARVDNGLRRFDEQREPATAGWRF